MFELIFGIVILFIFSNCVRMVPLDTWYIVERMGTYNKTWKKEGIHFKLPLVDSVANKISKQKQSFTGNKNTISSIDGYSFEIKPKFEFTVLNPKIYTYTLKNAKKIEELIVSLVIEELRSVTSIDIYRNIYNYNKEIVEKMNIQNQSIKINFLNLNIMSTKKHFN